jgi:BMFP domain-containing protein YqiC
MPKSAPLLDDLLTLGGSLLGYVGETRHELKSQAKTQVEMIARKLDLVGREEFDVAFAMLSKARSLQDDLLERIERIEKKLDLSSGPKNKKGKKSSLPSIKQGKNSKRKK